VTGQDSAADIRRSGQIRKGGGVWSERKLKREEREKEPFKTEKSFLRGPLIDVELPGA